MHYRKALQAVIGVYKKVYGSFYENLPDFDELSQKQIQDFLIEPNSQMWGIVRRDELGVGEVMRFSQEMDVIFLLFVICVWGAASEDVPISLDDFCEIGGTLCNMCVAGIEDEIDRSPQEVANRLIEEGIKTHQLPDTIRHALDVPKQPPPS